jgi:simple sugar transport system substrate-binding protein
VAQPTVSSSAVTPGGAEQPSNLTFYVITHGLDGPGWSVAQRGAEQAGKDLGVTVLYEESNLDTQLQSQMIMAAVSKHPAGIAISLADTQGLASAAKAVVAAKIPLYTLNSGINDYKAFGAVTHVGQNEILAGEGFAPLPRRLDHAEGGRAHAGDRLCKSCRGWKRGRSLYRSGAEPEAFAY